MRTDIRFNSDPVEVVDTEADDYQPKTTWGLETFPKGGSMLWEGRPAGSNSAVTNAYGFSRIRLIPARDLGNMNRDRGLYLHGKQAGHFNTHGCLCDKKEVIQNYFISGCGKNYFGKVPLSVIR